MTVIVFKPFVFLIFVASLAGISLRRARDAGLPAIAGLFIPIMMVGDSAFGVLGATPFSYRFSGGAIWGIPGPLYAIFTLLCIALLSLMPSAPLCSWRADKRSRAELVALTVLAALLCLCAILHMIRTVPTFFIIAVHAPGFQTVMQFVGLAPYLMAAFLAVASFVVVRARSAPQMGFESGAEEIETGEQRSTPPGLQWCFLAGTIVTGLALLFGEGPEKALSPIGFIVTFTWIVLPTYVLYTMPILALWRLVSRPNIATAALVVLALGPFALWLAAYEAAKEHDPRERTELAAIAKVAPPHPTPDTILYEDRTRARLERILELTGAKRVILRENGDRRLMLYAGKQQHGTREFTEVTELPAEYLHLIVGRGSSFAKDRQIYWGDGGPFELRHVTPGNSTLIGAWYREFYRKPVMPPVLTTQGWYAPSNTVTTTQSDNALDDFVRRTLRTEQRASALD
ncbi:hypothetical protein [Hyphomicrobium sp.]|uniref:hypothetical protein n=1 Tax=Hyphomicrobium sp. TaxID=82 RepID=UPI003F72043E